ncbi:MAG: ABC transporter substrate-binding protein [Chloroflexota bacterium]
MTRWIALGALAAVLVACGDAAPAATGSPNAPASAKLDPVKIAYVPSYAEAPLLLAGYKDHLKQYGIEPDMIEMKSGADIIPAVGTGQVDVAGIGVAAGLFSSVSRGVGLKVVAPINTYPMEGTSVPFLVRKALYDSGEVRSAKDLKGRRVPSNGPGGINEYQWIKLLQKYGLKLDDIQTQYMPIPDAVAAFKNGAVDAALQAEPVATQLVDSGLVVLVKEDSNPIPGAQGTFIVFSGKFSQERPDVAKRFMLGYIQAIRDVHAQPASPENLKVLAKVLGSSEAIIQKQTGSAAFLPNPKIDAGSLADEQKAFFDRGEMKDMSAPLPPERLIDSSFLDAALKTLGTVNGE